MSVGRWVSGLLCAVVAFAMLSSNAQASNAQATVSLPIRPPKPAPVAGIPEPCVSRSAWPEDLGRRSTQDLMERTFGIELVGQWWTSEEYRPVVKIVWETLDAISCTTYLAEIKQKNQGKLVINAAPVSGWAWGDWSLTRPGALTFDFAKWMQALGEGDPGRLVRLVIHEMGHAYNVDRYGEPDYWAGFMELYAQQDRFSGYGTNATETYADVLGYFVARCAKDNPFDQGQDAYYDWVRDTIFHGAEFGPRPGQSVDCTTPGAR